MNLPLTFVESIAALIDPVAFAPENDLAPVYSADRLDACDRARRVIEAVRRFDADRAPGWIACSERMPEPGRSVLVIWYRRIECRAWVWDGDRWTYFDGGFTYGAPSHWMPMPEPPDRQADKLNQKPSARGPGACFLDEYQ